MSEINDIDFEEDQQEIIEKTDISTLANYCKELKAYEDEISDLEDKIKYKKEKADKISSEIIPNLLAEQGLSSLKLADGSSIDVRKTYRCTIKKDMNESVSDKSENKPIEVSLEKHKQKMIVFNNKNNDKEK